MPCKGMRGVEQGEQRRIHDWIKLDVVVGKQLRDDLAGT